MFGHGVGEVDGEFDFLWGVCPGRYGKWIVGDQGNSGLRVLSGEGDLLGHLLKGELYMPRYVCVTRDGHLLVPSPNCGVRMYTYL